MKEEICLQAIRDADEDREFLFRVYAATRSEERALTGWSDAEWMEFLRMQFRLQHTQYLQNYPNPSFDIILCDGVPAGRFYVHRRSTEFRVVDIALLPSFRGRGIAGTLLRGLLREADADGVSVSLHVEKFNSIQAFYQRLGFRTEAETGVYFYMVRPPAEKDRPI